MLFHTSNIYPLARQELAEQEGDHKLALDDLDRRLREQCAQRLDRAANLCQKDTALKLRQQKNRCPFNWQDLLDSSKHQAQFHRREHARLRTEVRQILFL